MLRPVCSCFVSILFSGVWSRSLVVNPVLYLICSTRAVRASCARLCLRQRDLGQAALGAGQQQRPSRPALPHHAGLMNSSHGNQRSAISYSRRRDQELRQLAGRSRHGCYEPGNRASWDAPRSCCRQSVTARCGPAEHCCASSYD